MKKSLCLLLVAASVVACSKDKETVVTKVENQVTKEDGTSYEFITNNRVDYFKTKHMLIKNLLGKLDLSKFKEGIEYSYHEQNLQSEELVITTNVGTPEQKEHPCKYSYDYEFHVFQSTNKTKTYTLEITKNHKILSGDEECTKSYSNSSVTMNEFKTMKKERFLPALFEAFALREQLAADVSKITRKSEMDSRVVFQGNSSSVKSVAENGSVMTNLYLTNEAFDVDNMLTKRSLTELRENLDLSEVLNVKLTEACRVDFEFLGIFSAGYNWLNSNTSDTKRKCGFYDTDKGMTVQEFLDGKALE